MDEKTAELIKENKHLLRVLSDFHRGMEDLRSRVKKLEQEGSYFARVEHIKKAVRINA